MKTIMADAAALAAKKRYMVAISHLFESLSYSNRHMSKKRVVDTVIDFIKKHFPPSIVVDIDGAKPAKDIEVVRRR